MPTDFKTLLATFGLSGIAICVGLYCLQKWIDRRFDHLWRVKEATLKLRLEMQQKFMERQFATIQKLQQRISDSRNTIRLYQIRATHDHALAILSKSQMLTDSLYEAQPFIDKATTYDSAHLFKRAIEKATFTVDIKHLPPDGTGPSLPAELQSEIERHYVQASRDLIEEMSELRNAAGVLKP